MSSGSRIHRPVRREPLPSGWLTGSGAVTEPTNSAGNTPAEQQAVSTVTVENAAAVAAMLVLENQAIEAVSGPLRRQLSDILRLLASRYVLMFGGLDRPTTPAQAQQLVSVLTVELEQIRQYDPVPALTAATDDARRAGVVYANRHLPDPVPEAEVPVDKAAQDAVEAAPAAISDAVDAAQQFAQQLPITGWDDAVRAVGKASQAASNLEGRTSWVVNRANSSSISYIAAQRGALLLWVAEPDACVVCLALSGHTVNPAEGEGFDETATFGKPGSAPDIYPPGMPLMRPPRHRYCRCHPEIWYGPAVPAGGPEETSLYNRPGVGANVDLPAALRREAKRSILYGWSLPSESNTARLDAAARLLAKGAGLPKSVEAKSRAAVNKGKFDNRVHPSKRRTARRP